MTYRNDTSPLPLGYAPTYTAAGGVVTISPFSVASGPGDKGLLKISCTTADTGRLLLGSQMRPNSFGLLAQQSAVMWTTAAATLPCVIPSTAQQIVTLPVPLAMRVYDAATLSTVVLPDLPCSVAADSRAGSRVGVVLLGQTQLTTVNGLGSFSLGVQGPPNVTVALFVSCTWSNGQTLTTGNLFVTTCPLIAALGVRVNDSFAVFGAAGADSALLPLREGWAVTAAPSGSAGGGLQPLAPAPALVLLTAVAPGFNGPAAAAALGSAMRTALGMRGSAALSFRGLDPSQLRLVTEGPPVSCTLGTAGAPQWPRADASSSAAAQAAWSAATTVTIQAAATALPQSDAAAAWATAAFSSTALLTGAQTNTTAALSATTQTGGLVFQSVGYFFVQPNALVALAASCMWQTGNSLASTSLVARAPAFELRWLVAPPLAALPSGTSSLDTNPTPGTFLGLSRTPTVQLWVVGAGADGLTTAALTTFALVCSMALADVNNTHSLVGTATVLMNAVSGVATWPGLAITGSSDAAVALTATCTWISGTAVSTPPWPVAIPPLRLVLAAAPARLQTPSTQSSFKALVPLPTISIVDGSGATVRGMRAVCSFSLPAAAGLTTLGTPTVATPASGDAMAAFSVAVSGGTSGGWGAKFSFVITCTLPSSVETLVVLSPTIALISPRVSWIMPPPLSLLYQTAAAGTIAANFSFADPLAPGSDLADWPSLGIVDGELSCSVTATPLGGVSVIPFAAAPFATQVYSATAQNGSAALRQLSERGLATFPALGVSSRLGSVSSTRATCARARNCGPNDPHTQPYARPTTFNQQEGQNITLFLTCYVRGQMAAGAAANITIAALVVRLTRSAQRCARPPAHCDPKYLTRSRPRP